MTITSVKNSLCKGFSYFAHIVSTDIELTTTQKVANFLTKISLENSYTSKRSPLTERDICAKGLSLQIEFSNAIQQTSPEFVSYRLQENSDFVTPPLPPSICEATDTEQGEIAATLYELSSIDQESFLHFYLACQNGLYRTVTTLLEIGLEFPLTQKNVRGYTCLHALIFKKEKEKKQITQKVQTAKKFLEIAPELINIPGKDNNTALHIATAFGEKELVALFLKFKANINIKNKFQNTALFQALNPQGEINMPILKNLISQNSLQLETLNAEGLTALQFALRKGLYNIVTMLLNRGASITPEDKHHLNCFINRKRSNP